MTKNKLIINFFLLLATCFVTQLQAANLEMLTDSASVSGKVMYITGEPMQGVTVYVSNSSYLDSTYTDAQGNYTFDDLPTGANYFIDAAKASNPHSGITMADVILVRDWILQSNTNFLVYNILSMDMNNSGAVTTFDIVAIMKLILNIDPQGGWRFIYSYYNFNDPFNPWAPQFPGVVIQVEDLQTDVSNFDLTGYKLGDVNQSVNPNE